MLFLHAYQFSSGERDEGKKSLHEPMLCVEREEGEEEDDEEEEGRKRRRGRKRGGGCGVAEKGNVAPPRLSILIR